MSAIKTSRISNVEQEISVITPESSLSSSKASLLTFLDDNLEGIYQDLYKFGGVLFRNFDLVNQEDFLQITSVFSKDNNFDYKDGNSPRTNLGNNIFTSTEYPKEYDITLHNELSYSSKYPKLISFFCETPAESGGETPVLDGRKFLLKLSNEIVDKFSSYGVRYSRFLSGKKGLGKTWMETFETEDKNQIDLFCKKNNVEYSWKGDNLYLCQHGVGILKHPSTSELVWFNQANQFHPSSLPEDIYRMLKLIHKDQPDRYPQFATFGNGEQIPEEYLNEITKTSFECSLSFKWQKGDLLILDNILMAHGRRAYSGYRKILVTMC